ncbi:MAG: RHS repeat-associated core domain-containing protein [Candidatus Kapabacteria bacterium]|nr:RHS repeat-associated core domain-containing protein [Candidatus Kapabacteria bacterium]
MVKAQKQFPNYQEGLRVIWDDVGLKDIKSFDYKPFGELDGGDEPTKHGFATAEYDGESSCFAMGMRMYSAELGRFLSVDPLFEAMPRHTTYHYSFNSPLVWKDPSGLIPENEKDQDRLMERFSDDDLRFAYETYYESTEELMMKKIAMDNFIIASRAQMERMAYATDLRYMGIETWILSDGSMVRLGGRTGEDGRGSNGQKPNLQNAKELSKEEKEILETRKKKSKLLDDTMTAFDKKAKEEGKTLVYHKIGGNSGWAMEDRNDKDKYHIYLPESFFDFSTDPKSYLYILAHEYYHFTEWLTGDLNGNVHSSFTVDGVTYNFLEDDFQALQFGNSVLLDYFSNINHYSEKIIQGSYFFYSPNGREIEYIIPVSTNELFHPDYNLEHYYRTKNYKR